MKLKHFPCLFLFPLSCERDSEAGCRGGDGARHHEPHLQAGALPERRRRHPARPALPPAHPAAVKGRDRVPQGTAHPGEVQEGVALARRAGRDTQHQCIQGKRLSPANLGIICSSCVTIYM